MPSAVSISIHTPRVGSDILLSLRLHAKPYFNPHSPCGERRVKKAVLNWREVISIHTPRVGSDGGKGTRIRPQRNISIHTPRVGSDGDILAAEHVSHISIHTPRVGSDRAVFMQLIDNAAFQSTLPVWGATPRCVPLCPWLMAISIHTPRVGSDAIHGKVLTFLFNFNPHSPCGERHHKDFASDVVIDFNPHSPCGERPISSPKTLTLLGISIHTPRVGSDFADHPAI